MLTRNALARRVGLVLGLCALAAMPVSADDDNGYGYLRVVEGSATLVQAGSGDRAPAEINQPVLAGDRLFVPARSRVEIVLADRNLLRIDGGSEVALERLAGSPDSRDRGTVLRLMEGNLQLVVVRESLGEELPRIDTPNATIYVQDYGVFRVTADQEIFTELVVRDGRAEVVTDRASEAVRAGEQAFVEGDSRIDVDAANVRDSLERWAERLDEEGRIDSQYLSGNLRYAAAPLHRYGSWVSIDGGHYWRPRVDAGWRPYTNGRWIHTPSGFTWVAYEPWGWVPHHYGSWDYFPAHGWVWQPGYRWAPAWVYWYWGPSYTGWCPTGYYTRYYGSRWGRGLGFHFGVYGWAGGSWDHYNHWTFVSSSYWRGYRNGYRDGYRDGRYDDWRNQRNVGRYAVPIDQLRRHGPLDRGLVTTDTRRLRPDDVQDPRRAVRVLSEDPTARRVAGRAGGELPDVTDFVARKPDLEPRLRRAVVDDGDGGRLDGTPLRPGTLGRRNGDDGASPRGARPVPADRVGSDGRVGSNDEPGRPRIVVGDGDRSGSRSGASPRAGRPAAGDSGGAPRPDRAVPQGDNDGGSTRYEPRSGNRPGARSLPRDDDGGSPRSARPAPSDPGGAPRPDQGSRGTVRPAPTQDRYDRPATSNRDRPSYTRPDTRSDSDRGGSTARPQSDDRPRATRPPSDSRSSEPRSYERPAPSERPSSSSRGSYERPSSSPRTYERPAPPSSSSRGGSYDRPSSPSRDSSYERPSSSRGGSGDRSSARSGGRSSSDRGSSSGSSGGRSARRPPGN